MKRSLTAALLTWCLLGAATARAEPTDVRTTDGIVTGKSESAIETFKGIPYATAPVGELRWQPPRPVVPWKGVRDSTKFGAACPQDPAVAGNPTPQSEDCLFLNVWAPAKKPRGGAPVLVWIHGGGNVGGAGSQSVYDGSSFARDGVVVVTINYRLGVLGFLAHPALQAETHGAAYNGNFGTMDQIAALRWVKANIARFGGDPQRVTLAGQSAGGEAVLFLMTTKATKGLFQKVIAQSAPGWRATTKKYEVAQKADIARLEKIGVSHDVTAATLRATPPEKLFTDYTDLGPYLDGKLLQRELLAAFEAGADAPVPLLIGSTTDEGSLLAAYPEGGRRIVAALGPKVEAVRDVYRLIAPDEANFQRQLFGDAVFGASSRRIARLHASVAPTYVYSFGYVTAPLRAQRPGASHVSDVLYQFETAHQYWPKSTDEDRAMERLTHSCWVSFIKDDAPSCPSQQPWPRYSFNNDKIISFSPAGAEVEQDYRKSQFDSIEAALFER